MKTFACPDRADPCPHRWNFVQISCHVKQTPPPFHPITSHNLQVSLMFTSPKPFTQHTPTPRLNLLSSPPSSLFPSLLPPPDVARETAAEGNCSTTVYLNPPQKFTSPSCYLNRTQHLFCTISKANRPVSLEGKSTVTKNRGLMKEGERLHPAIHLHCFL